MIGKGKSRFQIRGIAGWLLMALAVIVLLLGISQFALFGVGYPRAGEIRSALQADYGAWPPIILKPVLQEILEEIGRDEGNEVELPVLSAQFWATITPTEEAAVSELLPSSTPVSGGSPRTATPTVTPTATRTPRPSPTPTLTATDMPTDTPTATSTASPSSTFTPTSTNIPPSATNTAVVPPSRTPTSTSTSTQRPTETATVTAIPSATSTLKPTSTSTATSEPPTITVTPSASATPTLIPPPSGINIGLPDGEIYNLECGQRVIVDLGAPRRMVLMFYYEAQDQDQPGFIDLDWVIIEVGAHPEGPWSLVFNWGNTNVWDNGSIHSYHYEDGEMDNELIPFDELNENTGILIGVGGSYQYIRFSAPSGCSDPAQIDAIQLLP